MTAVECAIWIMGLITGGIAGVIGTVFYLAAHQLSE